MKFLHTLTLLLSTMVYMSSLSAESTHTSAPSVSLLQLINERLGYMEDVALFKAQRSLPIEDIQREKIVLTKATLSARKNGLDPTSTAAFFSAQIAVAKAIQFRYRADLLSRPTQKKPSDLQQEIRPALLRLGNQINQQMVEYLAVYGSFHSISFANVDKAINQRYITTADKHLLWNALQQVKPLAVH